VKQIYVIGIGEEADQICRIFRDVNAAANLFTTLDDTAAAARQTMPNLLIVAVDFASKADLTIQQIKRDATLKSVPVLVFYPRGTPFPEARARTAGANEAIKYPVERRELLMKSSTLLNIDKRRSFKTLLTIEAKGHSVIATSEDFSPGGVSFITDQTLREKEEVKIHFFLPGVPERIRLTAMITRKIALRETEFFYGARTINIDDTALAALKDFVEKGK